MYLSSEYAWKIVCDFSKFPTSPEKEEISRKYLSDEISHFDFVNLAKQHMDAGSNILGFGDVYDQF